MRIGPSTVVPQQRFDFTSITPVEFMNTVNELIRSGEMDLDETSPMVGLGMGFAVPGSAADATRNAVASQPFNAFEALQRGIDYARWSGDQVSERQWVTAAAALERYQRDGAAGRSI